MTEAVDVSAASHSDDGRPLEWAPREPAKRKRHFGVWIGVGAGVLALAAAAASVILIAPGTTIAGVPVGWKTAGAAADTLNNRLATVDVALVGTSDSPVIEGSALGARIDGEALAQQAFEARPMWNVTTWFNEPLVGDITLDADTAEALLRAQVPTSYDDPTNAGVVFDAATNTFITTPATDGTGINLGDLTKTIAKGIAAGSASVSFDAGPTLVKARVSDKDAADMAKTLNDMLATMGFYVGSERTVPVAPNVAASWITVTDEDGSLAIEADRKAIQASVDALPAAVNRAPVNAQVITNRYGTELGDVAPGVPGRELGNVSSLAKDYAAQIAKGNGVAELPVVETPFATTALHRSIDVNLSEQRVLAIENGNVVDSWYVSSGVGEFATRTGNYQVGWKTASQNMGDRDITKAPFYFQPDVKWVMYFNGDEAFHGVYWHSNWGTEMSHGCVGMPEWRAQWLYAWAPEGVDVNIYY